LHCKFHLVAIEVVQNRYAFIDVLISPTVVDDGHADDYTIDRWWVRSIGARSAPV